MVKPTVVSLFAGCGGSSLGYRMAGYEELLAIDFDDNAELAFKANFPEVPFWNRDITQVRGQDILYAIGLKKGELFCLDGSPPCQGFSTAGKRQISDPRNDLFEHFARLIEELEPTAFVMENVSGMIKGDMKGKFNEILHRLEATGYTVRAKLLNAANYGVPQSRQRIFFIGYHKKTRQTPTFPKPKGKPTTVNEAIKDIDNTGEEIKTPKKGAAELAAHTKEGEKGSKHHPKGHGFNLTRANGNKPSPTITKTFSEQMLAGILHPKENRYLTIKELKKLASFPENFQLPGTFQQQWARIGNAVMPNQMKAVSENILKDLKPQEQQEGST